MDMVTDALLKEFSKERGIEHLPEDVRFEHFCAFSLVRRYFSGESFDTMDLVTGSGGDTGIDSIGMLVNGTLITDEDQFEEISKLSGQLDVSFLFVQSETSSGFDCAKISKFGMGVLDFLKDVPTLPRNAKVKAAASIRQAIYAKSSKFNPANPICRLFYVTTGKWVADANLTAFAGKAVMDLKATAVFRDVTFDPVDAETIQKYYRASRNAVPRDLEFVAKVALPPSAGVVEAYIGHVPTSEFFKIIVDDSGTSINRGLFFDNVRDWLGDDGVNAEIKATLASTARDRFALMNNGVTIIVRDLKKTGDKFHLTNYSIVNGCQTSNVLFQEKNTIGDDIRVPIRLIHTQNEEIINSIVKSTNRQTAISKEQFFALEDFAKSLEQYFLAHDAPHEKLYYERRAGQYESQALEKTRIVTHRELVKAFGSMFLNEPHGATKSYGSFKTRVGKDMFAKGHRMEPYYTAALASYRLEFMFRNERIDPRYKAARYHILLAIRLIEAGDVVPPMGSNKMEVYANKIIGPLRDTPEASILKAVETINQVSKGNLDRDNVRTEAFTKGVIQLLTDT
jgi:hypothetical protein